MLTASEEDQTITNHLGYFMNITFVLKPGSKGGRGFSLLFHGTLYNTLTIGY